MAVNQFLTFGTSGGANVIDQVTYSGLAARSTGFSSGTAQSAQLNKVWRQSSIMSSVLAQLICDRTGQDAVDDGSTGTLLANLKLAVPAAITAASDATFSENSVNPASTSWVRGAMSAIATAAGFAATFAATGYVKFPSWLGGLVIQWGTCVPGSSATFPLTFPNAVYSIAFANNATSSVSYSGGTLVATGFSCIGSGGTSNYIAVGR